MVVLPESGSQLEDLTLELYPLGSSMSTLTQPLFLGHLLVLFCQSEILPTSISIFGKQPAAVDPDALLPSLTSLITYSKLLLISSHLKTRKLCGTPSTAKVLIMVILCGILPTYSHLVLNMVVDLPCVISS